MRNRSAKGFTLVELVTVVAVIGLLAAVSIPIFIRQQVRSKVTEGLSNVEALVKVSKVYYAEFDAYPTIIGSWPAGAPQKNPSAWDALAMANFGPIGFQAEGAVRYRYDIDHGFGIECPCTTCFTAVAYSNLDGDATIAGIGYFQRDRATSVECPARVTGWFAPLDSGGTPQYDVVAPWLATAGGADDY